jgi:hypothetical protein
VTFTGAYCEGVGEWRKAESDMKNNKAQNREGSQRVK